MGAEAVPDALVALHRDAVRGAAGPPELTVGLPVGDARLQLPEAVLLALRTGQLLLTDAQSCIFVVTT